MKDNDLTKKTKVKNVPNWIVVILAFLSSLMLTNLISNLLVVKHGKGLNKFRFRFGLNPNLPKKTAIAIGLIELIVVGLIGWYLFDLMDSLISKTVSYLIPIILIFIPLAYLYLVKGYLGYKLTGKECGVCIGLILIAVFIFYLIFQFGFLRL